MKILSLNCTDFTWLCQLCCLRKQTRSSNLAKLYLSP